MRFAFVVFLALPLWCGRLSAQELNCKITINSDQVQISDKTVFKDMERAITAFMNNRKWTNDSYKNHEKINCSIALTTRMISYGVFEASAQIIASRPVYKTNYETVAFNYGDQEFNFEYQESQPLDFNEYAYTNNLTSLLAFYAYIILAIDYDSFADLGGTPYLQKAYQILNNAQNSGKVGWTLGGARNRFALMESLNSAQMLNWRKSLYSYHRLGLDIYQTNLVEARKNIKSAIEEVKKVWGINPASLLVVLFFDAKYAELVNVFLGAELSMRREVYDLVMSMDPKRTNYQKLISN